MIPIKAAQSFSAEQVAKSLKEMFCKKDENGNFVPPIFEEPPLGGPVAISGCSKLEADIFGDALPIRKTSDTKKSIANPSSSNVTLAEAEQHLDSLQLRKYCAALELGKTSFIVKYERIVQEKQTSVAESSSPSRLPRRRSKSSPTASQTVDE